MALESRRIDARAISAAMRAARSLAIGRMRQQADEVGGEGVVGVRLSFEHHRWHGAHMVSRVLAVGTAVGFDPDLAPGEYRSAPSLKLADGGPFTSDLSGQDFVALLRAGYRPVTVAMSSAGFVIDPKTALSYKLSLRNEEMQEYTQGFFDARETAMDNLANDLFGEFPPGHPDAPEGIVGMTVSEEEHRGLKGVIEFTAVGTAVARLKSHDPRRAAQPPSPAMVVPLDR
jgi:uncharacterized protein YbjQ (UPF0145 family)